jgi:uncharacterized protein (TIGR03546 family)
MFVLTLTRKLYKVLSSDSSPSAIAFAVAFGVLAGSVPLTSGLTLCMLLAVLVLRVQISSALLAWGLMRLLSKWILAPLYYSLGKALLDAELLHGFWTWLLNLPVVAWFGFHQYAVLGGAVAGLVLGIALFYPLRMGVISYRRWLHEKVSSNRFFRWLTNFWIVKLLRFVFVGVRS